MQDLGTCSTQDDLAIIDNEITAAEILARNLKICFFFAQNHKTLMGLLQ